MADLTTMQTVKQGTKQFMAVATDKWGIASASVARAETHVSLTLSQHLGFPVL